MDKMFIERLLRSLKYECVFLECFRNGERNASQDRALERHDSGVHLIAPFALFDLESRFDRCIGIAASVPQNCA